VSSAKRRPRPTISSVISFMKIKNIKGPILTPEAHPHANDQSRIA
jgi:hypothetical protein